MSTAASTIRHAFGVGVEAIVILGIIAALAFGLALANGQPAGAGSVFAAKGGNGGGHAATTTQPFLAATPDAVAAGQSFTVSGSGFDPSASSWLLIETSSARSWVSAGVDSSGNFSLPVTIWQTGNATVSLYQATSNGNYANVASCNVTVS